MVKTDELNPERLWKYYQHADNLHSTRINFFLVAESLLIGVYIQLFLAKSIPSGTSFWMFIVWLFGIVVTVGWWLVNWRLSKRMQKLNDVLKDKDPAYKFYLEAVTDKWSSNIFLTFVLPLSTFILWICLLFAIFLV